MAEQKIKYRQGYLGVMARYPGLFMIAIAFLLPFQTFGPALHLNLVPILIAVWGMLWIIDLVTGFRTFRWHTTPAMTWLMLFVGVTALGLLWTADLDIGLTRLQVRLSMLAIPLVLLGKPHAVGRGSEILNAFIAGNLLAGAFCVGRGLVGLIDGQGSAMYYTEFSYFLHPSYYSLFLSIAAVALIMRNDLFVRKPWQRLVLIIIIIGLLFFLSSRTGLLAGAVVMLLSVLLYPASDLRPARVWIGTTIALLFLASWLLNYRSAPQSMEKRTTEATAGRITVAESKFSQSNSLRIMVWRSAIERIDDAWLTGYGTGDARAELLEEYSLRGYTIPLAKKLNAHNQYMEVLLETGVIGLAVLLALIFVVLLRAYSDGNAFMLAVISLYAMNFLFESMLNTQAGTISIALFLSVSASFNNQSGIKRLAPL